MTAPPSRPSASIAPQSAASLATRTGSGVTLRSVRPSACKWPIHSACEPKACKAWPASLSMTSRGRLPARMYARGVDDIARRPAEQTAQESQARFARPGAEGREPVGADVGGEAALASVARPGVVDGDERRADEPRPQHGRVLGAEPVQFGDQEPNHLPLGDGQAKPGQQLHDA